MQIQFDATQVQPAGDRTPIARGRYKVMLKNSEIKPTADQKGKFIACGLQILEGPFQIDGQPPVTIGSQAGKMAFFNINYLNENATAQQIGQEQLSALCHAVQVLRISDTTQLHGRPFMIDLDIQKTDPRYNEVRAFFYENGASLVSQVQAGVAQPGPAAPPAWAGAAAPTPAPVQLAPAPQPQAPPQAPPQPAPAPAPAPQPQPQAPPQPQQLETQYYAASGGQNLPGTYTAAMIAQLPQGVNNIQICPVGGSAWQPATTIQGPAPAPAVQPPAPIGTAGALPPWMQQQPPQQPR